MKNFDWGVVQYNLAPLLSPVAVALVTGTAAYSALLSVDGIAPLMAVIGGAAFGAAAEVSGGLAFTAFSRAVVVKSTKAAWVAAAVIAAYIGVVVAASQVGAHPGVLSAAAALPVVTYGAQAVYQYAERVEALETQRVDRQDEMERLKLQAQTQASNNAAAIARANARGEQARSAVPSAVPSVPSVPRNTRNSDLNPERLALARAAYAADDKITTRKMAAAIGSPNSSRAGALYLAVVSGERG